MNFCSAYSVKINWVRHSHRPVKEEGERSRPDHVSQYSGLEYRKLVWRTIIQAWEGSVSFSKDEVMSRRMGDSVGVGYQTPLHRAPLIQPRVIMWWHLLCSCHLFLSISLADLSLVSLWPNSTRPLSVAWVYIRVISVRVCISKYLCANLKVQLCVPRVVIKWKKVEYDWNGFELSVWERACMIQNGNKAIDTWSSVVRRENGSNQESD